MKNKLLLIIITLAVAASIHADDNSEESSGQNKAELARKLSNPVAALISVPIEYNKDSNIGPDETGELTSIKFSPVYPFDLSENWNLLSRTVFSYLDFDVPEYGIDHEKGFSDIAESLFFSPKRPTESGWIWGVGGLFLLDTATNDVLGGGKWGAGPTAVALRQTGPWTVGVLTHYLVSFAGDDDRDDIEEIFVQPFLTYHIDKTKTAFTLQSEATFDLENHDAGAFILFQVGQMFKIGPQIMQGRVGVRHWFERNGYGPNSTELNLKLTFLFVK